MHERNGTGLTALVLVLILLVSCGQASQNSQGQATSTIRPPTVTALPPTQPTASVTPAAAAEATAAVTATAVAPTPSVSPPAAASADTFQNPVLPLDFPDPFILQVGDTYYAYATNGSGRNIQRATSPDLIHWTITVDAMAALPSWASLTGGLVWAPEVMQTGSQFVLYYTARDKASNKQCVGAAVSDGPEKRFKDTRSTALVCQAKEGGTIDASPFQDGDKRYLYFKNDGNCCAMATWIYAQELAADGLSLVGEPTRLIRNDQAWEGSVIEAPSMWKQAGRYYLFFSANSYAGVEYAVGYATCDSPLGPCQKADENPILKSLLEKPPVIGPGHQTLLQSGEQTWIFYHAWEVTPQGLKTNRRKMWMDRLNWENGKPVIQGPTTGTQPLP